MKELAIMVGVGFINNKQFQSLSAELKLENKVFKRRALLRWNGCNVARRPVNQTHPATAAVLTIAHFDIISLGFDKFQ